MEDLIKEIGIDEEGRLYVKPATQSFPMMYREAMEVHWNSELGYLYGARPRKWDYFDWFSQIIKAASEQGCNLEVSSSVTWVNVPYELKNRIMGSHNANST